MISPLTGKKMELVSETRVLEFRQENFEVKYQYYKCADTQEEFVDEALGNLNLSQVYHQYRVKHNLPFPEEIKETRTRYGVSASGMSEILGFGINQYRLYESGAIPTESHARLIQMAATYEGFIALVKLNTSLKENKRVALLQHLEKGLMQLSKKEAGQRKILKINEPTIFNGYRKTKPDKAFHFVRYFAEQLKNPLKTSMNKVLFYADFLHFKKYGIGISGLNYRAIQWGPVPSQFEYLFNWANEREIIHIEYDYWDDKEVVRIEPGKNVSFQPELFSDTELGVMHIVVQNLGRLQATQLVELSHMESAWTTNIETKSLISYLHAFELNGIK